MQPENEIAIIQSKSAQLLDYVKRLEITNDETRDEGSKVVAECNATVKKIKKLGEAPIASTKKAYDDTRKYFQGLAEPWAQAKGIVESKIGRFWQQEREAQRKLQQEELRQAHTTERQPEIVEGPKRSVDTEAGKVTVRELKTFDLLDVIIDSKAVNGSDLTYGNPALQHLPKELFSLDLVLLRKMALTGVPLKGLRLYTKPSVATREA